MVPWSRRRWLSVSSLVFAGRARRFRRAGDPGTTVARSVPGRVRRHDVAGEYGARTAEERLSLTLIGSGRASRPLQSHAAGLKISPTVHARTALKGRSSSVQRLGSRSSNPDQFIAVRIAE